MSTRNATPDGDAVRRQAVPCRAPGCKGELLEQGEAAGPPAALAAAAPPPRWRCTACRADVPGSDSGGSDPGDAVRRAAALWQECRSTLAVKVCGALLARVF